jgi:hypothetical protein
MGSFEERQHDERGEGEDADEQGGHKMKVQPGRGMGVGGRVRARIKIRKRSTAESHQTSLDDPSNPDPNKASAACRPWRNIS